MFSALFMCARTAAVVRRVSDVTKVPKPLNACLPATRCVRVTDLKSHYLDVGRVNLCCLRK